MDNQNLLQPVEVVRSDIGYWIHPDIANMAFATNRGWELFKQQQNIEVATTCFGDDAPKHVQEAYEDGSPDFSGWNPTPPEGDGWFMLSIYDTEDMPVCMWARRKVMNALENLKQRIDYFDLPKQAQRAVDLTLEACEKSQQLHVDRCRELAADVVHYQDRINELLGEGYKVIQERDALKIEVDQLKLTALPVELTPLVKSVLSMMCFKTSPYAHIYQSAGFDIPKKTEEEQAFVLHRWLLLALQHGNDWPLIAQKEVEELLAKGKLWAVNIPLEPDSGNILHAALDKAHAEQIVKRLHSEIDVAYPNVGNAMKYYITVEQWLGTSAEHAASLAEKWWEQASFKTQEAIYGLSD